MPPEARASELNRVVPADADAASLASVRAFDRSDCWAGFSSDTVDRTTSMPDAGCKTVAGSRRAESLEQAQTSRAQTDVSEPCLSDCA